MKVNKGSGFLSALLSSLAVISTPIAPFIGHLLFSNMANGVGAPLTLFSINDTTDVTQQYNCR
ncbi:MAG: hypothetical protein PV340_05670 [Wolbachia sp.]|nr:hypothetical protein [Wolbachia sp.]MDD9336766.1 hypothetical protein [Wolbachia sp.]